MKTSATELLAVVRWGDPALELYQSGSGNFIVLLGEEAGLHSTLSDTKQPNSVLRLAH